MQFNSYTIQFSYNQDINSSPDRAFLNIFSEFITIKSLLPLLSLLSLKIDFLSPKSLKLIDNKHNQRNLMNNRSRSQGIIHLTNVSKSYHTEMEVKVLSDLNLTIHSGLAVLLGPSGCGKTTLLNLIGGLDCPSQGKILFEGEEIPFDHPGRLVLYRRHKIGFIFQFYNLLPTLTALENLEIILDLTIRNKKEKKALCFEYLRKVGMEDKANRYPYQLSGGEQQRIAMARALVKNSTLVLADEPTGNLDEKNHHLIMDLIRRLVSENKTTFILATHNQQVVTIADQAIFLRDGRIEENRVINSLQMDALNVS